MCKVIFNLFVASEECEKAESGKSSSFPAAHNEGGAAWWRSWSVSLNPAGTPLWHRRSDAAQIKERHHGSTTGSTHSAAEGTFGVTSEEIRSKALYLAELPCRVAHKLKPRFAVPTLGLTGDGCWHVSGCAASAPPPSVPQLLAYIWC